MKKLIFTLCAISAIFSLQAKNNTYHVDDSGCVTVGACKISKDLKADVKGFSNTRKPERAEISDHDPRQSRDTSTSWFKW